MKNLWRRLFRRNVDDDLREELDFHLQMRTEMHQSGGMSETDARAAAQRQFGNTAMIQEDTRRVYVGAFRESLSQDVRYACRSFLRTPGFTLTVLLILALGIGSTTAVFSVVDRILFRSLPYPNEDRLLSVGVTAPLDSTEFVLAADYRDWQRADTPFESLGSFVSGGSVGGAGCDLTDQDPLRVSCAFVDSTFLPTLGIEPFLGRNFSADEDRPNVPRVVVISYGLWQTRFGGDPDIIGRTVSIDTRPASIIGVLPRTFEMPSLGHDDILLPEALDPASLVHPQTGVYLRVFGRLKRGLTIQGATAAMAPLFQESLKWVPPAFRSEVKLRIRSVRDRQIQDVRTSSWVLVGAVFVVMLITCANVANLLLARGASRKKEFAMRAALGASRRRLVRQTLTESLFLSILGSVAGILVAWGLLHVFTAIAPAGIPRLDQAALDVRVLLFSLVISLISGTFFSLAPIFQIDLSASTHSRTIGSGGAAIRHSLVAMQIAASLVLLTAAGLLLQSLWNLQKVPLGMTTESVITGSVILGQRYTPTPSRLAFYRELEDRIRQIPGLTSYAVSDSVPLLPGGTPFRLFASLEVSGRPRFAEGTGGTVTTRAVTEDYFATLGISIIKGRPFRSDERSLNGSAIILSESLARRLFPNDDPVGKQIHWENGPWRTVVGIAANVKNNSDLAAPDDPELYVPHPGGANRRVVVSVRTAAPVQNVADSIRSAVAAVDPVLPVTIKTMPEQVRTLVTRPRFNALLLGFFALTAVTLAATGLFGVTSFLVARRTSEIGLRLALGASSWDIERLLFTSAVRWTSLGITAGLVGSLIVTRGLRGLLFQVSEHDFRTFVFTVALLESIALLSAWIPSRRAVRIDAMVALRQDE